MGLFSSLKKVGQSVIDFNNPSKWISSFDGSSQQADANYYAMQAWNLANDYNHPIQQMERLRAAGLNPLLVYGSGSATGNTTSQPNIQGGGVSTGLETAVKLGGKALAAMQGMATLDQTYASTAAQNASAGASTAQAANLNAQAALNQTKNKYEEKSLIADLDYKMALADRTRAEADIAQGEAEIFGSAGGAKGVKTGMDVVKGGAKVLRGLFK